jgi:dTDP-glucose pyrophosphorylase
MTVVKNLALGSYKQPNSSQTIPNSRDENWKKTLVLETATIQDTISCLDKAAMQIVMVVNPHQQLIGTITDGDIRRALLNGLMLDSPIDTIIQREAFVVPESMEQEIILKIMSANSIRQIPIIDENRQVVGLHTWENLTVKSNLGNPMVIMAGGLGTRLHPITQKCPKPLLPVYGKPIMEHILVRAIAEGFCHFYVSVNHLSHMIEDYFGDGNKWGVEIEYIREDKPLGTAGALTNLKDIVSVPFVVTNGDVLTHMRYSEFLDFHINHHADATMAVRVYEWQNPFGVVNIDGLDIIGLEEKPIDKSHINAGIYVLDPAAFECLKPQEKCDMPTLFDRIRNLGNRTVAYPMHEPWLDIGRPDDFERAENYFNNENPG